MNKNDYAGLTLPDFASPDIAESYLADLLVCGELSLVLGAGVSMSLGLPSWADLVARCQAAVGIESGGDKSARQLMEAIDEVRRALEDRGEGDQMLDLVRRNLYPDSYLPLEAYPDDVLQMPMLIAIGAMIMSSSRGSVSQVVTFNFDDLLEWYLHLHGFTTQIISDYPTLLRGDVDISVFHPHGFLPLARERYSRTSWLVLSHRELVSRLSDKTSKWTTLLENMFISKRFLAVGSSMNDLDIEVLLADVKKVIPNEPLGFLVAPISDAGRKRALMESGIVPIEVASHDAIPDFLLAICRRAAASRSR